MAQEPHIGWRIIGWIMTACWLVAGAWLWLEVILRFFFEGAVLPLLVVAVATVVLFHSLTGRYVRIKDLPPHVPRWLYYTRLTGAWTVVLLPVMLLARFLLIRVPWLFWALVGGGILWQVVAVVHNRRAYRKIRAMQVAVYPQLLAILKERNLLDESEIPPKAAIDAIVESLMLDLGRLKAAGGGTISDFAVEQWLSRPPLDEPLITHYVRLALLDVGRQVGDTEAL